MNKETDNARWQGKIEEKQNNHGIRLSRIEKFLAGLVLALAALYLRSIGVLP